MQPSRAFVVHALTTLSGWFGSERWAAGSMRARTLVFAPHPDDEVLGCGGTIVLKVRSGAAVQVVIMTDGAASHSQLVTPAELVRIREQEALDAASRLGLPQHAYRFLGFADHALAANGEAARVQVRETIERFRPDEIFIPHHRDVLGDHVATHDIVQAALAGYPHAVAVLEYPVWLWNTWPWTTGRGGGGLRRALSALRDSAALVLGCRARVNIQSAIQAKLHALAAYRSQLERRGGNPDWPILSDVSGGEFLGRFAGGCEVFRRSLHRP